MKFSFLPAFVLIILFTVTFYSCERIGGAGDERVAKGDVSLGGTFNVAISEEVDSYLPSMISNALSSEIGTHLHCGLLNLDPQTLEVIPGIAERWSVDNKGTSFVFNLRQGAKFHPDECFANTGRDITAHDFKYSFEILCGGENNIAFETTFKNRVTGANAFNLKKAEQVIGVQVIDDYTLRIELDKPDESFLFVLAQPSTAVVSEKAFVKYGAACKVGAGPFKFLSNEGVLTLVRNLDNFQTDAFGNNLPYIDTLVFATIRTKQEELKAFFNNEIDLVSGLYLDPVKVILEKRISSFSGQNPAYVLRRETESAGYESYSVFGSNLKGFGNNFMGYRDFSRVQLEQ